MKPWSVQPVGAVGTGRRATCTKRARVHGLGMSNTCTVRGSACRSPKPSASLVHRRAVIEPIFDCTMARRAAISAGAVAGSSGSAVVRGAKVVARRRRNHSRGGSRAFARERCSRRPHAGHDARGNHRLGKSQYQTARLAWLAEPPRPQRANLKRFVTGRRVVRAVA